jgi:hypothetical protein
MADPVADASQGTLAWAVESTFKTPPGGTYQLERIVSESLGRDPEIIQSDEIDGDRQVVDNILAFVQAGGGVPVEFSYLSHDDWLRYALLSGDWAGSAGNPAATKQVVVSGTQTIFRLSSGTWPGFVVGQIVRTSGFATAANNGYWKIAANATTDLTCEGVGTNEGATAAVVVQLDQIVTGSTLASMTLEREYTNLATANSFAQLTGMVLSGFTVESSKRDKVRGEFRFMGATEQKITSSDAGAKTAAPTNRVYSVNGHLDTFVFNNDRTARMTNFRLNYENGLYVIDDAGFLTAEDIGIGDAVLDGTYDFWYRDPSVFDEAESFSDVNFLVAFEDDSSNGWGFEVVQCNLGPGRRNLPGKSQGTIGTMQYQAKKHPTELITLRMFRT